MKKNSIIQEILQEFINLLFAAFFERKWHVPLSLFKTDGLSYCCLLLSSFTTPVFSNFLLNFFSAFSMFSPSFTGTTIMFLKLKYVVTKLFMHFICGAKLHILSLFTKLSGIFSSELLRNRNFVTQEKQVTNLLITL